ncbi:lmo0937 family membrane protein [bacterium]|nr:lmo0937 family membrane protein [bacterium]
MLWTIAVIILVLWLLGFITSTGGGLIHILLVIAVIVIIIQLLKGKK